jgi:O-antigen ligase
LTAARAQWPVSGAVLGLCAAFGLLAGISPLAAIAAAVASVFALLVVADLTAGLCVFVLVAFAERIPAVGGSDLTLVKALGALLAISWLAAVATHRAGERQFFTAHPGMSVAGALLLAWMVLSVGWAEDSAAARGDVLRYALNFALLPIVYAAVRRREHVAAVLGVYVGGAVLSALIAFATREAEDGYGRISGLAGTANELASLLVSALLLAAGLLLALRQAPLLRLLCAAAVVVCLLGLFLTLSRAGLVALGAALVAALFVAGRRRLGVALLVAAIGLATLGYFSFAASEQARERVTTIGGGTGRLDIWTVGLRMVEDEPLRGVGVGNFRTASIHYLLQPGAILRDEFIVDRPQVAHNVYLHVVAELGVVGLALFLVLVGAGVLAAWRAAREFARRGEAFLETCARALVLALVALLAADFFASDQLNKELWLLLGLGPALLGIARSVPEPAR